MTCKGNGQVLSQEVLSSSGGNFIKEISLDWTMGEVAITEIAESEIRITQGFHQPLFLSTKILDLPIELGEVNVYPNPFSEILRLDLKYNKATATKVRIFTAQGQVVWEKSLLGTSISEDLNLNVLTSGSYYLHLLIDGNRFARSFKLHKIN